MKICINCGKKSARARYGERCSSCQQLYHDSEVERFLEFAASSENVELERDRERLKAAAKTRLKAMGIRNPSDIEKDFER